MGTAQAKPKASPHTYKQVFAEREDTSSSSSPPKRCANVFLPDWNACIEGDTCESRTCEYSGGRCEEICMSNGPDIDSQVLLNCIKPANPTLSDQELLRAAMDGDPVAMMNAIDNGANVDTRSPFVQVVGRDSAGVEEVSEQIGTTPLMCAMHSANKDGPSMTCVHLLLMARASVNTEDSEGNSPLHFAAKTGDIDLASTLIWAGAYMGNGDPLYGEWILDRLPQTVRESAEEVRRWKNLLRVSQLQTSDAERRQSAERDAAQLFAKIDVETPAAAANWLAPERSDVDIDELVYNSQQHAGDSENSDPPVPAVSAADMDLICRM